MATQNPLATYPGKGVVNVTWSSLANGDDGRAEDLTRFPDKTVQVKGTFGAGGTIILEGSNDGGTTYHTLNDSRGEGNALSFTAADMRIILENASLIRPRVTAGDGTTSLTVIILATTVR